MHQVQIRVKGQIDPRWSEWLGGLAIAHTGKDETLLAGTIPDQPALYGLLSKLRDLGLVLLAVEVGEDAPDRPAGGAQAAGASDRNASRRLGKAGR